MKQKNFFKLLSISIVMMLFSMNVWADRGWLKTSGYWQIQDPTTGYLSKYITSSAVTFENWMYFDDVTQMYGLRMFYNVAALTGIQYGFTNDATKFIIQNGQTGRTVDLSIDYKNLPEWAGMTIQKWIHLALVIDGNNWKIYLDGAKVYDQTLGGGYTTNNITLRFAQNFLTGSTNKGKMAEIRVWNVARTETEIVNNMRKIIPADTPGLLGRINFGEGSGATSANLTTIGGGAWPSGGVTYTWGVVSATPTNLQTPEITSSGFTLTWDGGPETEYKIALTNNSTSSTTYYTTNSKSHTFTDLAAGSSYNVKVMSTMPLETEYSAESQVSLITSAVNKQQIDGIKLITNDSQWQITSKNSNTLQASIYSLSGNCIGVYTNQNQISIDRSGFSQGVYLIKVNTSGGKSVFKVIN